MALFDLPLSQLERYSPDWSEPADFDDFWARTLSESRHHPIDVRVEKARSHLRHVDCYDMSFRGYGGDRIHAWYLRPAGVRAAVPVVVNYIGYGGGRGMPWDHTAIPSAGYAFLRMDSRGQGWDPGMRGDTPDSGSSYGSVPGVLTRGIESPETYYYRRLFTDAARAIDAVRDLQGIDPTGVVASGGSQGGGIALAAAALVPDIAAVHVDVPFLQHMRRAVEMVDTMPYREIRDYLAAHRDLVDQTWRTLSYFDGLSMSARARTASIWSVALMDTICPPSTVYASYNRYAGEKSIEVYPYNGHEGGGSVHLGRRLAWMAERFAT